MRKYRRATCWRIAVNRVMDSGTELSGIKWERYQYDRSYRKISGLLAADTNNTLEDIGVLSESGFSLVFSMVECLTNNQAVAT